MSAERRQSPRIPLDAPCLLTLVVNDTNSHHAMAVDVSSGGVQLALPPGYSEDELEIGLPVSLKNVPPPLDGMLEGVHGKIAWVGVRCCGIRLNRDIPVENIDVADLARL